MTDRNDDGGPRLALRAIDQIDPAKDGDAMASLFDGPVSTAPKWVRDGIWVANINDASKWGVKNVAEGKFTLAAAPDIGKATKISHATFSADMRAVPLTFDYWAFTVSDHRYLLSYARTAAAKTPGAAAFFATAISCPNPKP